MFYTLKLVLLSLDNSIKANNFESNILTFSDFANFNVI